MKSAVFPWTEEMELTDAYRAPLAEVFPLLEAIQNYQDSNSVTRHFRSLRKWQSAQSAKPNFTPGVAEFTRLLNLKD
ncbi:hypothetical protein J6590_000396 [Homalodisca vitripennis]|nr:hypothetical protein J6590_000396 [Homalodisca vitripennis]